MGKQVKDIPVRPQETGAAVQDGNEDKKWEVNKMIFKKETEEIIENFIAEQLQDKTISPEMVAAIARLIETLYA